VETLEHGWQLSFDVGDMKVLGVKRILAVLAVP
jgi:hypothetical protein